MVMNGKKNELETRKGIKGIAKRPIKMIGLRYFCISHIITERCPVLDYVEHGASESEPRTKSLLPRRTFRDTLDGVCCEGPELPVFRTLPDRFPTSEILETSP